MSAPHHRRTGPVALAGAFLGVLAVGTPALNAQDVPKPDEHVMLFPTAAWYNQDAAEWVVPLHGWIYEPETDSLKRNTALKAFRTFLGLDTEENQIFRARALPFVADNERGKRLILRVQGREANAPPSGDDGHFHATLRLPRAEAPAAAPNPTDPGAPAPWIEASIVTGPGDGREFRGRFQCVPVRGVSVISDIDDTIKITGIGDDRLVLENTFLKPLEPVPGMAPLYADLTARGAVFHYVSAAPWQLFGPLDTMLRDGGFPPGSVHLKGFRWKDERFLDLFAPGDQTKRDAIDQLLERYPHRRFLLIGDDAERDPELFEAMARRHAGQVVGIAIRRSAADPHTPERLAALFDPLPTLRWTVFTTPDELRAFDPVREVLAAGPSEPPALESPR